LPAEVAEQLNELLALAASAKEFGDPAEAESISQPLHDVREVVDLTKLGLPGPPPNAEHEN